MNKEKFEVYVRREKARLQAKVNGITYCESLANSIWRIEGLEEEVDKINMTYNPLTPSLEITVESEYVLNLILEFLDQKRGFRIIEENRQHSIYFLLREDYPAMKIRLALKRLMLRSAYNALGGKNV